MERRSHCLLLAVLESQTATPSPDLRGEKISFSLETFTSSRFFLSLPQFAEVKNGSVCKKCLRKARAVVKAAATFRSLVSKKKIFRFGTNTSAEFTFTYPPSQTEGSVPSSQPAEPEPPSQRVRQPAPSGRVFIRSTKLPVSETFSFEVAT